jgi:predicted transcriptional regulator
MSNSKALLIGIDYLDSIDNHLHGCINDIEDVKNMLIVNYKYLPKNIIMLSDISGQSYDLLPTHANIISNLNRIIKSSKYCNEIWIHYSGHGSRIIDISDNTLVDSSDNTLVDSSDNTLVDSSDNTLVDSSVNLLVDSSHNLLVDISDNLIPHLEDIIVPLDYETNGIIKAFDIYSILKNSECKTFAVFDCCNSATITDLPWSFNYNISSDTYSTIRNNSNIIKNQNIIALSGCKDNQTSVAVYNILTGRYNGILTQYLLETLKQYNYICHIKSLYSTVYKKMQENGYSQIPILSSSSYYLNYLFLIPPFNLKDAQKQIQINNAVVNIDKYAAKHLVMSFAQQRIQPVSGVNKPKPRIQMSYTS